MEPTDQDPQHCCKKLDLYLFQEGQKAGEDGEKDQKEADISQSGVGLEHGNQSFGKVLMKTMCKAVRRNNSGNRQIVVGEKILEKNNSFHPGKSFIIHTAFYF